jgi:hypothetical protein
LFFLFGGLMVVTRMPTVTGSVTFTVRILRRFRLLFFLFFFPIDLCATSAAAAVASNTMASEAPPCVEVASL